MKKPPQSPSTRRLCRVATDERGNPSVEWIDVPPDEPCPTVELKKLETGLSLAAEKAEEPEVAYDPYSNSNDGTLKRATRKRTNLRQLSEWIKMVRNMKETKDAAADDE